MSRVDYLCEEKPSSMALLPGTDRAYPRSTSFSSPSMAADGVSIYKEWIQNRFTAVGRIPRAFDLLDSV